MDSQSNYRTNIISSSIFSHFFKTIFPIMKFFKSLTLGAASLFVVACGGGANTPESVALGFSQAMGNLDIAKAKEFTTAKGKETLGAMEGLMGMMPEAEKAKAKEQAKSLTKATCKVDGDKASCTICCGPDGKDSPEALTLVKENGKWAVEFDKGAMGGGDTTPEPADTTTTAPVDTTGAAATTATTPSTTAPAKGH